MKKKTDPNEFNEQINKKETGINKELFTKHFKFKDLVICLNFCTKQRMKEKQ